MHGSVVGPFASPRRWYGRVFSFLLIGSGLLWAGPSPAGVFILPDYPLASGEFPRGGEPQAFVFDINDDGFAAGALLGAGVTPGIWAPSGCPPDCQPPEFNWTALPSQAGTSDLLTAISNIGADGFISVAGSRFDPNTGQLTPIVERFFNTNPSNVTTIALPIPNGFANGEAVDVNHSHDVVGYVDTAAGGAPQAIYWDFVSGSYVAILLDALIARFIRKKGVRLTFGEAAATLLSGKLT